MSIKTLTDLPGLKEGNLSELEQIGITSVPELRDAIFDEKRVKEVIKNLSGVGPKTVETWKKALQDEPKEQRQETKEPKSEPKAKEVEIVDEPEDETEITESGWYTVKAKPQLTDETADALALRAIISGRRPAFKRQEWFRYAKLGEKWRKPKGIHSKMKRQLKRRPPMVDIGFRGPVSVRGLHPSGFEEVLIHNVDGLEGIDPKVQAVRIGGTVGTKKRIAIEDRAAELGIRVLNRMV
ncbi:MAG: 50S ribosomal protein L32e [Candidatus Methanoplasma sp.]|jgi:large subunit ribosomal protein L32e|nr:50S ribosomal protein L32e [Candidatus Methanoplasma sp.]